MAKTDTPPPPVNLAWRDVTTPKSQEDLEEHISRGVARALELACTPKDLVEAIEAATEWYKVLYAEEDGGQGSALGKGQGQ